MRYWGRGGGLLTVAILEQVDSKGKSLKDASSVSVSLLFSFTPIKYTLQASKPGETTSSRR